MHNNPSPNNEKIKKKLKIIGSILLTIGLICTIIGFIDFFTCFSSGGTPSLFFLFFIGFPFIGVGGSMLSYAVMGKVARYTSGEVAPVAKDTINYIIDGVADNDAFKRDNNTSDTNTNKPKICGYCYTKNDHDAAFCVSCGKPLLKKCPSCGEDNEMDSKYCKNCGNKLC